MDGDRAKSIFNVSDYSSEVEIYFCKHAPYFANMKRNGVTHIKMSPYHSSLNGLAKHEFLRRG